MISILSPCNEALHRFAQRGEVAARAREVLAHAVGVRRVVNQHIRLCARVEYGGLTDLETCFQEFNPNRRRYGIIFVISDLYGRDVDEAREAIRHASAWPGEVHFIQVYHPWEEKPDVEGEIELLDVETQEHRRLWFTPRDRKRYEERYKLFLTDIEQACQSRQIDYQRWRTDYPFDEMFLELLSRGSALSSGNS